MKHHRSQLFVGSAIVVALAAVVACSGDSTDVSPVTQGDAGDGGVKQTSDGATSDSGSSAVWPSDATKLVAKNAGGGLVASPPDAGCTLGAATYTLTVSSRLLESTRCVRSDAGAYSPVNATKTLSAAELASLVTTLQGVSHNPLTTGCGADKPALTIAVSDPRGDHLYTDSFYACRKDTATTYVDNVDPVFAKLGELAGGSTL